MAIDLAPTAPVLVPEHVAPTQTAFAYAKAEFLAGRFPNIVVLACADRFALVDAEYRFLNHPFLTDRDAAFRQRSNILARARKASGV